MSEGQASRSTALELEALRKEVLRLNKENRRLHKSNGGLVAAVQQGALRSCEEPYEVQDLLGHHFQGGAASFKSHSSLGSTPITVGSFGGHLDLDFLSKDVMTGHPMLKVDQPAKSASPKFHGFNHLHLARQSMSWHARGSASLGSSHKLLGSCRRCLQHPRPAAAQVQSPASEVTLGQRSVSAGATAPLKAPPPQGRLARGVRSTGQEAQAAQHQAAPGLHHPRSHEQHCSAAASIAAVTGGDDGQVAALGSANNSSTLGPTLRMATPSSSTSTTSAAAAVAAAAAAAAAAPLAVHVHGGRVPCSSVAAEPTASSMPIRGLGRDASWSSSGTPTPVQKALAAEAAESERVPTAVQFHPPELADCTDGLRHSLAFDTSGLGAAMAGGTMAASAALVPAASVQAVHGQTVHGSRMDGTASRTDEPACVQVGFHVSMQASHTRPTHQVDQHGSCSAAAMTLHWQLPGRESSSDCSMHGPSPFARLSAQAAGELDSYCQDHHLHSPASSELHPPRCLSDPQLPRSCFCHQPASCSSSQPCSCSQRSLQTWPSSGLPSNPSSQSSAVQLPCSCHSHGHNSIQAQAGRCRASGGLAKALRGPGGHVGAATSPGVLAAAARLSGGCSGLLTPGSRRQSVGLSGVNSLVSPAGIAPQAAGLAEQLGLQGQYLTQGLEAALSEQHSGDPGCIQYTASGRVGDLYPLLHGAAGGAPAVGHLPMVQYGVNGSGAAVLASMCTADNSIKQQLKRLQVQQQQQQQSTKAHCHHHSRSDVVAKSTAMVHSATKPLAKAQASGEAHHSLLFSSITDATTSFIAARLTAASGCLPRSSSSNLAQSSSSNLTRSSSSNLTWSSSSNSLAGSGLRMDRQCKAQEPAGCSAQYPVVLAPICEAHPGLVASRCRGCSDLSNAMKPPLGACHTAAALQTTAITLEQRSSESTYITPSHSRHMQVVAVRPTSDGQQQQQQHRHGSAAQRQQAGFAGPHQLLCSSHRTPHCDQAQGTGGTSHRTHNNRFGDGSIGSSSTDGARVHQTRRTGTGSTHNSRTQWWGVTGFFTESRNAKHQEAMGWTASAAAPVSDSHGLLPPC